MRIFVQKELDAISVGGPVGKPNLQALIFFQPDTTRVGDEALGSHYLKQGPQPSPQWDQINEDYLVLDPHFGFERKRLNREIHYDSGEKSHAFALTLEMNLHRFYRAGKQHARD